MYHYPIGNQPCQTITTNAKQELTITLLVNQLMLFAVFSGAKGTGILGVSEETLGPGMTMKWALHPLFTYRGNNLSFETRVY